MYHGSRLHRSDVIALCAVGLLTVIGLALRYYDICSQVIVGDEWHSIRRVANVTVWQTVTTYYRHATAIPLNVYTRVLLDLWGWSELALRIPTILASSATLLLLPWTAYRALGSSFVSLVVAALFATSSFWIFYGQSARPYGAFLFLVVLTYHCFEKAGQTTRTMDYVQFGVVAALAIYFHLFALPIVAALGGLSTVRVVRSAVHDRANLYSAAKAPLAGFAVSALIVAALYGPALARGIAENLPGREGDARFDGRFMRHFAELLTGVRSPVLAGVLVVLSVVGLAFAYRRNARFVAGLVVGLVASVGSTLASRPHQFQIPIVMARYNVTAFIVYFLGLACLVDELDRRAKKALGRYTASRLADWTSPVIATAFFAVYIAASPIPQNISLRPNNFRLHSAFQESYEGFDRTMPYVSESHGRTMRMTWKDIPAFYLSLGGKLPCRLVEYPVEAADDLNPHYFYQMQHHCDVIVGYSDEDTTGKRLNAGKNGVRFRFRHLVAVDVADRVRGTQADYVVVHLDSRMELKRKKPLRVDQETKRVLSILQKAFGAPAYEDRFIRAFRVRG